MMNVPYSHAIGSVMYMMVCTRPDLAHAISVLSRYMSNPGREHWEAVKWLMRYLKGSTNVGLLFEHCPNLVVLEGFADSDFARDKDKRRSTSAYMFTSCGSCVSWKSQLHSIVALSSTEAKYIAATETDKESIWLKGLLEEFIC